MTKLCEWTHSGGRAWGVATGRAAGRWSGGAAANSLGEAAGEARGWPAWRLECTRSSHTAARGDRMKRSEKSLGKDPAVARALFHEFSKCAQAVQEEKNAGSSFGASHPLGSARAHS